MAENGDARVPDRYRTVDDDRLGSWVERQRGDHKNGLSDERIAKLKEVEGWVWKVT